VIGADEAETITKLVIDGQTRLAAWEAKHNPNSSTAAASTPAASDMPSSLAYFDSIENPPKTEETEKRAEINKDLGNKYYKEKDFPKAIESYTKAIDFNKYNANYWSNRSASYLSLKQFEKALIDAEICRRLKPNWVKGCFRLAQARLGLGLFEDAAVAAFEGCKLEPNNQEIKSLMQLAVKKGQEDHQAKLQQQKQQSGSQSAR
jgi:tetratricopeptide (TPR) repeat protein